jgi:hypothetical protein
MTYLLYLACNSLKNLNCHEIGVFFAYLHIKLELMIFIIAQVWST